MKPTTMAARNVVISSWTTPSDPAQIEIVDAELAEEESVHSGDDFRLVRYAQPVRLLRLLLPGLDGEGVGGGLPIGGGGSLNRRWLHVSYVIVDSFMRWRILILRLILIVHGYFPSFAREEGYCRSCPPFRSIRSGLGSGSHLAFPTP